MRPELLFTATLLHTAGDDAGLREEIEVPRQKEPPAVLRRPTNLFGSPSFEIWALASTEEWAAPFFAATYAFAGYTRRDPNVRPSIGDGLVLPWRILPT